MGSPFRVFGDASAYKYCAIGMHRPELARNHIAIFHFHNAVIARRNTRDGDLIESRLIQHRYRYAIERRFPTLENGRLGFVSVVGAYVGDAIFSDHDRHAQVEAGGWLTV